jgi:hypothetical protein
MADNLYDFPLSKVVSLSVKPVAPNEQVISLLRDLLKEAKEGKIQGIGVACACVDSSPGSDAGKATETIIMFSDGWSHTTSAAVSALWMRINFERYANGTSIPAGIVTDDDE